MKRIKLNKKQKKIIKALSTYSYTIPVPKEDLVDFLKLESIGLVTHLQLDQSSTELYGPDLTNDGYKYLACNPKLKNPCWITKDDVISFLAQVTSNVIKH